MLLSSGRIVRARTVEGHALPGCWDFSSGQSGLLVVPTCVTLFYFQHVRLRQPQVYVVYSVIWTSLLLIACEV